MEATGRLETNNNNYQYKGLKDLADRIIISITQAATKSKALKGCCSQEAKLPNVNLTIDLRFVLVVPSLTSLIGKVASELVFFFFLPRFPFFE